MALVFDVTECFANQLEKSFLLSSTKGSCPGLQVLECDLEAFQHCTPHNSNPALCLSLQVIVVQMENIKEKISRLK